MAYIYPFNPCRSVLRIVLAVAVLSASIGCGPSRVGTAYHPNLEEELAIFKSSKRFVSYVVKSGDTLWSVAKLFGTTVGRIVDVNGIGKAAALKVGHILKIPIESHRAGWNAASGSTRGWIWPVRGDVITSFGQTKGRLQSSGIDIRARTKAEIVAAGNGVVRKAGPFAGLGGTVIIQHDKKGEIITLCSGLGELVVSAGDSVRKGQKIASASSVAGGRSIVHFRMFRKGIPVDPRKYLP